MIRQGNANTGRSVDLLRLTTTWYRTILLCCLYRFSYIPSSLIMGFLNLLKKLNAFMFVMNDIVVISKLLPIT